MKRHRVLTVSQALAALVWMTAVTAASVLAESPSLVVNGDFELLDEKGRAQHWQASRIEELPDGNHVIVVPFTWSFNQKFEIQPKTRYLLAMDVKRRRGPSAARMAVSVRDKGDNRVGRGGIFHSFMTDGWETARGLLITPPEAHYAILYLLTRDKDRRSAFLCDNVRVTPLGDAGAISGRVWSVRDPLYEGLLGEKPPGLVREGAMVWGHMLKADQLRDVAARMGLRYSEDETFAHLSRHKLHPISVPINPLFKRHGVTTALYPGHTAPGARTMLHPLSIDHYLGRVRHVLTEHPGQIWAVFAQDEAEEHAIREIVALAEEAPADYDYLRVIQQEVSDEFGFGKFGLPTGEGSDEPFRWIAFRRWINARFRHRHERLSKLVRTQWPEIRLISTDPMGRLSPYEFSRQVQYFDIFTQQFLPRSDPTRCPLGLYTKLIADLTGKEVWPCVHVENYAYATTPDEVRNLYSQVWRNGGSGFHLYLPDTAHARKKKGDTRLTQWGSPRRYRTILDIIDRASKQNRLRFQPDEGCRILYSNYAHMAFASSASIQDPMEACYTLLGPLARSWFTIIDEHRLVRPLNDGRPKAIYLPYGRIMDGETRRRLDTFVQEGGTLIVGDPEAFEYQIDGTRTRAERVRLVGADLAGRADGTGDITIRPHPLLPGLSGPLRLLGLSWPSRLRPAEGTSVLGAYDDGSPAITLHRHGKGRVIYFGLQPFVLPALALPEWQQFFKSLQRGLGFSADLDIWRFTFPPCESTRPLRPEGVCLTNNHIEWREETAHMECSAGTGGTYCLSPPPDAAPDDGGVSDIAFDSGDLTDRTKWPELEKVKAKGYQPYVEPLSKWVDTWQRAGDVIVTFDFKRPRRLLRARVFFSGSLPDVHFEGSGDGASWATLGRTDGAEAGKDVLDVTIPAASAKPHRYARLLLGPRAATPVTLAEVEVWGARE